MTVSSTIHSNALLLGIWSRSSLLRRHGSASNSTQWSFKAITTSLSYVVLDLGFGKQANLELLLNFPKTIKPSVSALGS